MEENAKPIPNLLLRQEREQKNWSQKQLADEVGTTSLNISRWERGVVFPGPYYRQKLCALFGKSADQLGIIREHYRMPEPDDLEQQNPPIDESESSSDNGISSSKRNEEENAVAHPSIQQSERNVFLTRRRVIIGLLGFTLVGGIAWQVLARSSANHTTTLTTPHSQQGTILFTYRGHTAGARALAWSHDGQHIATASDDHTAQIWDALTGEHSVVCHHTDHVEGVAWSPENTYIVTGCADGTAQIWNVKTGINQFTYKGHTIPDLYQKHPWVNRVSWSPDGSYIASCDQTSNPNSIATVHVWEVLTGKTRVIYRNHTNGVYAVSWSPEGKRIASAGYDGTLQIWDAMNGTRLAIYASNAFLFGLTWSPDGMYVAVGSSDNTVRVVDSTNGNVLMTYEGHYNWVKDVAWSPNGKYIASSSQDGMVRIWNTANGDNIYIHNGKNGPIDAVGWSHDGKFIASGGNPVQVWEAF